MRQWRGMPAEIGPIPEDRAPKVAPPAPTAPTTLPLFQLGPWLWSSLAVVFWSLLVVTGLGLLFFYQPSPKAAGESLAELREATSFDFLRSLHYWASHGLIIAAWLHLMRVFVVGSYRRLMGWTVSVLLVALVVAQGWTGFLLPRGGAGTVVSLRVIYVLHVALRHSARMAEICGMSVGSTSASGAG